MSGCSCVCACACEWKTVTHCWWKKMGSVKECVSGKMRER
jgi:hypothetical protein